MENPFRYGGIVTGDYFADRTTEIGELKREMENLNRVFLVSPRRYGKTCLLYNLGRQLEKSGIAWTYLDLNAFPDLGGFAGALAGFSARALESNTDRLLKFFSGFRRLRPRMSMDSDGVLTATLEMSLEDKDPVSGLIEGMRHTEQLAARKKKKLVVMIDEFSDVEKYNGNMVEKAMRSEIQNHFHMGYIFSGSEQSVMLNMIQDKTRPFYKLGRIMALGPIRRKPYGRFIKGWLEKGGYGIDDDELDRIFELGRDVPYNIQRLCNTLWETAAESKFISSEMVNSLPLKIARQDSPHFEMIWQTATKSQKNLMVALSDDPHGLVFSKDFQMVHGIGPSSSIKASLDSLLKKGILAKTLDNRYVFVDEFMPSWIKDIRMDKGKLML